jgi:nitrite reductase/ring-hydroxylating ferredoxin subunit
MAKSKKAKKKQFLCKFSELEEIGSRGFTVKLKRKETPIFIVRHYDNVFGYENSCPHAQAPLEWNPDQFLDEKQEMILCAMHGAEFSIKDGECLGGPCNGQGLTKVKLEIEDNQIFVV